MELNNLVLRNECKGCVRQSLIALYDLSVGVLPLDLTLQPHPTLHGEELGSDMADVLICYDECAENHPSVTYVAGFITEYVMEFERFLWDRLPLNRGKGA